MTIWHLLVILIFLGVIWGGLAYMRRRDRLVLGISEENQDAQISGWLALLVVGMVALGPLIGAGRIAVDIGTVENQFPQLLTASAWSTYKTATWMTFASSALISMAGGIVLAHGRRRRAVHLAIAALWISGPVAACLISFVWPSAIFPTFQAAGDEASGVATSIVAASIWTAYLLRSARVKARYVEGDSSFPPAVAG